MLGRVGSRALLAGVISIGLASTAWAGVGNRVDLTDVFNEMDADSLDAPLTLNRAFVELFSNGTEGIAFASGSVAAPGTGTTATRVQWVIFEPDQVKRSDNGGQAQQRNEVALTVVLNGTQLFSGLVPGCKAKVQAKGPRNATKIDRGNWSVHCSKQANDTLQLSDQQLTDLRTALGKKVVGKSSLDIKGKCTDTDCNIPLS